MMTADIRVDKDEFSKLSDGSRGAVLTLDRNYAIGTFVTFREMNDSGLKDTGRVSVRRVTDVQRNPKQGNIIAGNYVILSLSPAVQSI